MAAATGGTPAPTNRPAVSVTPIASARRRRNQFWANVWRGTRVEHSTPEPGEQRESEVAVEDGLLHRRTGACRAPSREGREPSRILVVDADPQTLRYVRDALVPAGYAPVVTGDPQKLSDLVEMHEPALVLLDLMLPEPMASS